MLKLAAILIAVAFTTLFERKVLSLAQLRLGPNKISLAGLLQPITDALKLLTKGLETSGKKNLFITTMGPVLLFSVWVSLWMVFPPFFSFIHCFIMFFSFLAISVFGLFFSGWGPTSKYSSLGSIRSGSQSLSYEVSMFLLVMWWFVSWKSILSSETQISILSLSAWMALIFSVMAETNRAPMDLAEGESEIISGFNIEFSGVGFVLLFLGEYSSIIFFCFFLSFLSGFLSVLFFFFLILVRSVYARIRYDTLMLICWFIILPAVISMLSLGLFIF